MDEQITIVNAPPEGKPQGRSFLNPKIIFIILGMVVLIEVIYALITYVSPESNFLKNKSTTDANITLSSPKTSYNIGEIIPVSVEVSTGMKETIGTDLVLHFDPNILEASTDSITQGAIYPQYPLISLDPLGIIRISGVGSEKSFIGTGVFADINFKAKDKGQTKIFIELQKDSTTDSNIVEIKNSKDILNQAFDLELTIK